MPIEYDHDHENEVTLFGQVNFRNQFRRFGIKTDDRRRHMYVIGKTGVGKTTLMENMMLSDILAGHGCCFIDPHGDTAEKLLNYIPSHRVNDVVYFNPADLNYPVGFNILETARDEQKHLVASGLMGVFKKIWPDVWSARMEYILLNCVLALLDYPGATLLGLSRLLVDKEYRKRVVAKIRNPIVKTFWLGEFTSWSEKYATEAIAPVLNKVGQFLSASIVRNIVAQVKSTINPREVMDEGKILIVNLSKGKIGEDNMRLLGGMLVTKLQLAAMERVDIKNEADRRDFYLYVDEFQNFANESFAAILSEARKYRLSLTVAHQYIAQLEEEVAKAIFGNVGTLISMRVGAEDAQFMENEFVPTFAPEDLVNLPKFNMYIKLMVDGVATQPFSATSLPPIAKSTDSEEKVVAVSRERYATERPIIEEKVLRWSGMEVTKDPKVAEEEEMEARIRQLLQPQVASEELGEVESTSLPVSGEVKAAPPKPPKEDAEVELKPVETNEYLRVSPERLEVFRMQASASGKTPPKPKPQFPYTCSRCGKKWEMPVKLDTSRPVFCSECMPIVREEQKTKKKPPPIDEGRDKGKPNRPRIVGDLPKMPEKADTDGGRKEAKEPEDLSLIAEIEQAKGAKVERKKERVGGTDDRDPQKKKRRRKRKKSGDRDSSRADNRRGGTDSSSQTISQKESAPAEKAPRASAREATATPTVFRSPQAKSVKPGEKIRF